MPVNCVAVQIGQARAAAGEIGGVDGARHVQLEGGIGVVDANVAIVQNGQAMLVAGIKIQTVLINAVGPLRGDAFPAGFAE